MRESGASICGAHHARLDEHEPADHPLCGQSVQASDRVAIGREVPHRRPERDFELSRHVRGEPQRRRISAHDDVDASLEAWESGQLELGRNLTARVRGMGERSQFGAGWVAGDPNLRFGLFKPGDSEEEVQGFLESA